MRREQRLRRRRDFAAAYRKGRIQSNQLLVLRVLPNGLPVSRFGFVAGKVVGGAVTRNLVKRRLREAARALPVRQGLDIVIGARKPAAGVPYGALKEAVKTLLDRAKALERPGTASTEETT